ncbi:UNVERIFIED_CONTAM: hypothetical protein Sindi_2493700, partial [Sesamum indicum]
VVGGMSATAGGSSPPVRSYQDAVAGVAVRPPPPPVSFETSSFRPMGVLSRDQGMKVLRFSPDEISQLSLPFRYALGFRRNFSVGAINVRHVFIKFALEEDYTKLWIKSIWFVEGFPMRVFKWTPTFNPREESHIVPIWIRLPELPIQFFDREALFSIAHLLGTPLRMDVSTATLVRPSTEIGLGIGTKVIIQPVVYERPPKYCGACKHLGHDEDECYEKHRSKARPVRPANRDDPPPPIPDQEDHRVKLDAQRAQKNLRDRRKEKYVVFDDGAARSRLGASTSGSKGAEGESHEVASHKDVPKTVVEEVVHLPEDEDDGKVKPGHVKESVDKHRYRNEKETAVPEVHPMVPELGESGGPSDTRTEDEQVETGVVSASQTARCELTGCVVNTVNQELPNCPAVTDDEVLGPMGEDVHQVDEEDVSRRLARHRRGRSMGDTSTDHSASPDRRKAVSPPHMVFLGSGGTMSDCAPTDAGYTGSPYTWYSRRLRQHLDRVLVTDSWMDVFPKTQVTHLELSKSDRRGYWLLRKRHHLFNFSTYGSHTRDFLRVAAVERDLKEADEAYDLDPCDRTLVERNRCSAVLVRVLTQEEAFWKQKAEIKWARDGERNMRYFHSLVKKRRFRGTIFEIQHEGEVLTDPIAIKRSATSFFEELLSAESVFPNEMDRDCLEDGLTDEDRCFLCVMPTMAEVWEAVFSIEPVSVAGPDGFGAIFYHTCWDLVLEDVFSAVSEVFRGIAMPKSFTATTISLIPKTASPASWSEYRPINLCNVTNKICMKLMSIRLGHVLPKPQELVHSLESQRPEANVIFKLDMAKAYDRVNWDFFFQVLRLKGFPQRWIDLVANAVSNCWFSVLVNGEHAGFFHSTRGLPQGDPLSPALFVLVADYLSQGLDRPFAAHPLMYYQSPGRVRVSHLAYADDMMILTNICRQHMELVPSLQLQEVQHVMGYKLKYLPVTYLGVPLYKGNRKGWAMMNLSHGGRLALIRSVLQATPLHLLQVVHPPKSVWITIERIFNGFFWGSYNGRRHIHWSSWDKMCSPVAEGGLGVRSLVEYVRAFSMKLWWRFRQKSSLWLEFLHDRYCRTRHPIHVPYNRNHSSVWHRLCRIRDVVEPLIFWILGQGLVSFWHDNWFGEKPLAQLVHGAPDTMASDWISVVERMKRKGFSFPSKCQCCEAEESISHLFVEGAVVREVWLHFANVFGLQLCEMGNLHLMVHFWRYSTPFHSDLHIRTLRQLRTLYAARIMTSIQWKGDLHRALAMGFCFRPMVPRAPRVVRWSTPTPAWFKLNSDGSSLGKPGPAAAAGVIRDEIGQVHLAYQYTLGTTTSVVSELTAVWRGLELARAHSLAPIVVEVDATIVLQLLQSRVSGMWEVQHLIMRILQLQQELGSDVRHVFREANGAADYLAKDAASRQLTRDWILVDERMKRKGFSFPSKCQCCVAEESISHLFVEGAVVRDVWLHFANVFGHQLCETGNLHLVVHFWRYSTPFHSDLHIRTLRQLRRLYAARIMTSIQWKGDLHRALAMGFCFRPMVPRAPRVVRWSTPTPMWFKLNSDGSSLGNPGPAPAVGVIRDEIGQVHLAYQYALGTATSVVSELTAIWRGLELARAHSLAPIVVEVDATVVLQLLQSRVSGMWEVQHLIMRILQLQQELGSNVRHVFREATRAADYLAKDAASRQLTRVMYQEDITGVLRGIIRLDKLGTPYLHR